MRTSCACRLVAGRTRANSATAKDTILMTRRPDHNDCEGTSPCLVPTATRRRKLEAEDALGEPLQIDQQRLTTHGDQIERASEYQANRAEHSKPHSDGHSVPRSTGLMYLALACHHRHVALAADNRGTARSWIGQCTTAAKS